MKINELMIGDWVIPYVFNSALEPSKIVGIHYNSYEGEGYVDWVDCEVWDELSLDEIKPIPLTDEILEKNGFIDGKYRHFKGCIWKLNVEGFRILNLTESCGKSCLWGEKIKPNYPNSVGNEFAIPNICYVHELQHAMRLLGINIKIEL